MRCAEYLTGLGMYLIKQLALYFCFYSFRKNMLNMVGMRVVWYRSGASYHCILSDNNALYNAPPECRQHDKTHILERDIYYICINIYNCFSNLVLLL